MTDSGQAAVDTWNRWVTELEDRPLDKFEYDELLSSRDRLVNRLEIAGSERLWTAADEIDARFVDLTVTEVGNAAADGWWRARVPKDPDALRYFKGVY